MTAEAVCCDHCGQFYVVPESFSEEFEQQRLLDWLNHHAPCSSVPVEK